jgi:hypothetical protein
MRIPMSFRHIVHRSRRSRHGWTGFAALPPVVAAPLVAAALLATGCAPRQAIVESEPGRAASAGAGQEVLRSDLRRLADAQETYRAANGYYAVRTADLRFTASAGVRVDVLQGDRGGWSAVAASGDAECGMYQGAVRPPRSYLTESGRVACR